MEQKPLNPAHQAALRTPITTADNNKLFWKHWKPSGPVKAHVTFVHGQSEHCSRYDDIFARFAEKGIEVICFDLRGHGMSSGVRGHSPFGPTHSDIDLFFEMADKSVPHFVYGHSLGGLLVASWVLARKKLAAANISPFPNISGVIITGALFKLVNPVPGLGYAARFLALFSPTGTMSNGVKADTITRDKEEIEKYSHDAFNHGQISFQTGDNIFYWTEQLPKIGNTFDVPVLIIHGEKDKITDPKGSQEFYDKIRSSDKTIKFFPEAFHEVHNELKETREECLSLIENWILDRLKPKAETVENVEKPAATEEKKQENTEEKKETN